VGVIGANDLPLEFSHTAELSGGSRPLSEIAFARTLDKPSVRFESRQITDDVMPVHKPRDAVARAFELLDARSFQGR
jgi:hypothetical protein